MGLKNLISIFALALLLEPNISFGKITAEVVKVTGKVLYNKKPVKSGDIVQENGTIEVLAKSYLQLKVKEYNSLLSIAPNSKLKLKFKKNSKRSPYNLVNGLFRWVTQGKAKRKGILKTKTAIMGVRGTDFLVVVSSLLGETEIYCFDGKVLFRNRKDKKDQGLVSQNDWGGIGGRFGAGVGDIVPMSVKQIEHVKTLLR
jgi:ribosomal 50S subunit-recycling heat shock protein